MPHYQWECVKCATKKDLLCKTEERPKDMGCPVCGEAMEWVPQHNGRAFKGQGWTPKFGSQ